VTWLIRLYPPAWRRRYGRELEELLATQPASYRTAIDLIAGAADAWLNPQSSTASPAVTSKGDEMVPKMLKLRCAGHGVDYTRADAIKAAGVTIGGTLVLTLLMTWALARFGENPYLKSLMLVSWLLPFLYSQRYTDLKGRSGRVQALFLGVPAVIVIAIALTAGWINS
jgi:hypothetical protein